jgi:hypothetical protein
LPVLKDLSRVFPDLSQVLLELSPVLPDELLVSPDLSPVIPGAPRLVVSFPSYSEGWLKRPPRV